MAARGGHGGGTGTTLVPPPTPAIHRSQDGGHPRAAVGGSSIPSIGKGTTNQDTFVTAASGSKCFAGVFDGHGEKGDRLSHFARDVLSRSLFDHEDLHTNPKRALESAYGEAQRQIEKKVAPDAAESGTTAVAAYQHRDKLYVANVGDSRAVLGRCDTARGNINAVDLSKDHKPSRPDERQRITAAGGKVDQGCFPVPVGGGIKWQRAGPERVMDKHGMGGLAVSRSLGDLSMRPYVSSKPEVIERRLDHKDKFLVLGSDGIWDQVSSKEAVDIAGKHLADPNTAAREIATVARKRWQAQTSGQLSDDITAVVVRLDVARQSPPSTPGGQRGASHTRLSPRGGGVRPAPSTPEYDRRNRGDASPNHGMASTTMFPSSPHRRRRDELGVTEPRPMRMESGYGGRPERHEEGRRPRTHNSMSRSTSEAAGLQARPVTMPGRGRRDGHRR